MLREKERERERERERNIFKNVSIWLVKLKRINVILSLIKELRDLSIIK